MTESNGRHKRRRLGVIAALAVLLGAFAWLIFGNLDQNVVFFLTPGELLAKGTEVVDKPVRLGGEVRPGSVKWDEKTLKLEFQVMDVDTTQVVRVNSKGAPPQMFRDGMGVVVEGRLGRDSVFQSTNLMIKHSNEYRPPKEGQKPQEMYRSLIKGSGA
ncbi:MAG: cytochrome c maturation protein CcmE [Gemmatimonadaceae bacterium]|nr:cytochrome c maturation protein CcmE [Gemmatimonadaceae bacterium]